MRAGTVVLAGLGLIIATEAGARLAFDFPLYGADGEQGYWVLPDQQGSFLFKNDWVFDHEGLGVAEEYAPSDKLDVLLVGDSLVYGGNSMPQKDKLGPTIEADTTWQVWPAGAGSWALQNELTFLRNRPELVAGSDVIVFVANSGDFGVPSAWQSELTHPRSHPPFYLSYLFDRYVREPAPPPPPYPVAQRNVLDDWQKFVQAAGKPVIVIAYSIQDEAGQSCAWAPPAFVRTGEWYCYDPMTRLGPGAFVDGTHPTVPANHVLARHIASIVQKTVERQAAPTATPDQ